MRILHVEDNPRDADLLRHALQRGQAPAVALLEVVPTLAAARRALSEPLRYDLVLVDLNLPDGHGLALVAEIRQRGLSLAVVALTGQGDEDRVVATLKAGANDYLSKGPDLAERIGPVLQAVWDRHLDDSHRQPQPLRVLYVEHSAHDFDLTRRHFKDHAAHLRLDWVPDAAAALARLATGTEQGMPWDLLLLDFRLSGNSGLDLLKHLRQQLGLDLPVVLVTGQGDEEVAALAMRLGAADYVVKRANYLQALPSVLESAYHRAQLSREHAALQALNATLEHKVAQRTAELVAAKEAAETANRSKSDFLARISHDLRTPLNAVIGFSQLLALNPALDEASGARQKAQLIQDAGQHLLAMVNDLLDLAAIESGQMTLSLEAVDAAALVQQCLLLTDPLAVQCQVSMVLQPSAQPLRVLADRTRLCQVLVNLLSNAVKYNRPGGQVQVLLTDLPDAVQLAVADNGCGMTPAQVAALYQPFNRLGAEQSAVAGSGLGLVIAKQLLEAMQGRLQVRSAPGDGSTFTVTLPKAQALSPQAGATPALAPLPAPAVAHLQRPRRVLYVEDNPVNVLLMKEVLSLLPGLVLQVAADGETALQMVADGQPDLVLLDLNLPGIGGLEVLRQLKCQAATAAIPCVAVSAYAQGPEVQAALDQGCVDYLTKPYNIERVLGLVASCLR